MKQTIATAKLPTLKEAKELAAFINRPINNQIVVLSAVAPKVSISGMVVGNSFQEKAQQELNRKGLMVIFPPDNENTKIKAGELVAFRPETVQVFSRVITSDAIHEGLNLKKGTVPTHEMRKQYVILVMNASDVILVLNKEE